MATIADLIAQGKELGIFQFYLPFIITFAVIYGILDKSKIFGDKAKNINLIISLSASLFVMAFTPVGPAFITFSTFISNLFAGTLLIVLTIIAFLIIASMLFFPLTGKDKMDFGNSAKLIVLVAAILGVGVFVSSGGLSVFPGINLGPGGFTGVPIFISPGISQQDLAIIVIVVITGLAIYWLNKGSGKEVSAK